MNALKKAEIELDKEYRRATETIYHATVLVLKRNYGYGYVRIDRFLDKCIEVYTECRNSYRQSLVQMCDQEMGIDIRSERNESYLECPYLCQDDWEKKRDVVFNKMNQTQQMSYLIRVRQKMKNWMFPQVLATVLLGLHRKEGFGIKRVEEFMGYLAAVREEYDNDIDLMKAAVEEETGMRFGWSKRGDFGLITDEGMKGID